MPSTAPRPAHGHSHGLVDDSIKRSRAGVRLTSACAAGAAAVALGLDLADPLIGLAITLVILRITWRSWQTVRAAA
jgi:divalent metal cation (Fe/Co/Zn/Cd) transporter